jgi:RNA-directed DNA polymerase
LTPLASTTVGRADRLHLSLKGALASVKAKVRAATREATNQPLATLCRLSPMVRGWINYFRHGVSKATFD